MKTNRLQPAKKVFQILPFLFLALLSTQCKGPRGENGIDGINYTHSVIYDINAADWSGGLDGYSVSINVPEITNDIYYNGAVLVYRLIEVAPNSFNLLPYTYVDNSSVTYLDFDVYVGSIDFLLKQIDNGVNNTAAPTGTMSFKVVIIEGISLAALKNTVDIKDFSAVSRLLSLDKTHGSIQ